MTVVTTRADFERLLDLRLTEAKLLLDQSDWDGAYYLAGYAVEFALKVKIIADLMKSNSFPDRKLFDSFYKHDLTALRKAAGVEAEMEADAATALAWDTVKDWSEQTRYQFGKAEPDARNLYAAIEQGVVPWIRARW